MGVIIRQGFKAAMSNYIGMFLGFLSLFILFPLFFEPNELGAVRLFLELGSVLSAFSLIGTHYSINRFFPFFKTGDQKHHGFFFWALIIPLLGYVILILSLLIFGESLFNFINPKASEYSNLLPFLLALIFILLYQVVTEVSCANHGRIAVPNFMREVVMRSLIIVSGSLYYFKLVDFMQSISLIVLSYFIALLGNIWFLTKLTKINLNPDFKFIEKNPKLKKEAISFTLMLFFSGVASLVVPKIDLFLISSIQEDLSEVAIYSIGFYLATFIEVPKRTILQVATPIISTYMKEEKYREVEVLNKKNGTNQLLISGILFFLIWLNIDNMYSIMPRGDFYQKGKWVVFFIGISKLIDAVLCGNSPIITNSKFFRFSLISIFVAITTSIVFNFILISRFGLIGGAISTILVMVAVNSTNAIILQYKLGINPFHKAQFKTLALLTCFFLLTFFGKWVNNPILDSVLKTSLLGMGIVIFAYRLKLSDEFNKLLKSKIGFLK